MSTYDSMPRFYDLEYDDFDDDKELYIGLAQRTGSPILDVGTGTGRIARMLAVAGYDVTGIDESASMLARARSKLENAPRTSGRLTFVETSAARFDGEGRFRLGIMALNTFGHLHARADQLRALVNIHNCLTPGGLLVIDLPNPDPLELAHGDDFATLHWERTDPTTGFVVQKWLTCRTDRAEQMQYYRLIYDEIDGEGNVRRTVVPMPIRYTHRFEAELLLERAGFAVKQLLGSYAGDEYGSDSERLILIAARQ